MYSIKIRSNFSFDSSSEEIFRYFEIVGTADWTKTFCLKRNKWKFGCGRFKELVVCLLRDIWNTGECVVMQQHTRPNYLLFQCFIHPSCIDSPLNDLQVKSRAVYTVSYFQTTSGAALFNKKLLKKTPSKTLIRLL